MDAFSEGEAHTRRITQYGGIRTVPRLTDATYLAQRHRLMDAWEFRMGLFAELEYFEQRDLHRFFAPSKELYDDDALAYRREMARLHPSLPSQAGRAYAHFERVLEEDRVRRANPTVKVVRPKGSPRPQHIITVRGVARPEIDAPKLARLIVSLAQEDEKSGEDLFKKLKK